jgi:hypothetical protein
VSTALTLFAPVGTEFRDTGDFVCGDGNLTHREHLPTWVY